MFRHKVEKNATLTNINIVKTASSDIKSATESIMTPTAVFVLVATSIPFIQPLATKNKSTWNKDKFTKYISSNFKTQEQPAYCASTWKSDTCICQRLQCTKQPVKDILLD